MQGVHPDLFEHLRKLSKRDLMRYASRIHQIMSVFMGGSFYALSSFYKQEQGEIDDAVDMLVDVKMIMKATAIEYRKLDPESFEENMRGLEIDPKWIVDIEEADDEENPDEVKEGGK